MVATLLRLRFQVLANTLRRSALQLVAVVLGAVQSAGVLAFVLIGIGFLGGDAVPVTRDAVVVGLGALVAAGWMLVPLAVTGVEPTLDPRKLAYFPVRTSRILAATLLVELLWPPGIATVVGSVASIAMWRTEPAAALVAVPASLLAALTCLVGSRAVAALAGNAVAGASRVVRIAVIAGLVLAILGPPFAAVAQSIIGGPFPEAFTELLAVTPVGAIWSVPVWVAAEDWVRLGLSAAIGLATLALLAGVWWLSVVRALRTRGSAGRSQRVPLGIFRIAPTTPAGGIGARSLVLWMRDARLARQLVILPALPILMILLGSVIRAPGFALAAGPVAAALFPLSQFAALSYDGTAFAGQLASTARGVDDRIGRSAAMLAIALPALAVVAVASVASVGLWSALPTVLGLTAGGLLTGLAVTAVSSALVVVPIPTSRRNPFTAAPGAAQTQVLGSYVVAGAAAALMLPELGVGIAALVTGLPLLGYAALAVGLGWGVAKLALGIRIGGRLLDRTAPGLLARLRRAQLR